MVAEPASPVSNQQPFLRAVQSRQVSCSTMPDEYKQQQKDAGMGNDHEELTLRSERCLSSRLCFSAPAVPVSPHCIMRKPALSKGRSLSNSEIGNFCYTSAMPESWYKERAHAGARLAKTCEARSLLGTECRSSSGIFCRLRPEMRRGCLLCMKIVC